MPSIPEHLHFSKHIDSNGSFNPCEFYDDEYIYRCFNGNKTYPADEYFSEMSSEEIQKGISTNRGKYCQDSSDVLWRNDQNFNNDIQSCNYSKRNGIIIYSIYSKLINSIPPPTVSLSINHSWNKCNVAHCDIIIAPCISSLPKKEKRAIRLFLASLFKSIMI